MVDTLVLGTSANAWEFESLHAQLAGDSTSYPPLICVLSKMRSFFGSSSGFFAECGGFFFVRNEVSEKKIRRHV